MQKSMVLSSSRYFLDSNIILRFLLKDHPTLSPKAKLVFDKISDTGIFVLVSTLVLHEVVYLLEKFYKLHRSAVYYKVNKILDFDNLDVIDLEKEATAKALLDYKNTRVDFPDCIYKQIVLENDMKLLSFDEEFKKIKIERFEEV